MLPSSQQPRNYSSRSDYPYFPFLINKLFVKGDPDPCTILQLNILQFTGKIGNSWNFFLSRNKFKVPQSRIDRNFVAFILFYFYFTSKSSSQILENLNCHGWIFDFSDLSNVRKGYLFRRRIQSSKILKKDRSFQLQKSQILIIPSNNSKFQNSQIYIEKRKISRLR